MKYFIRRLQLQLCSRLDKRSTHGIEIFEAPIAIFHSNHLQNELSICLSRAGVTFGFIINVNLIED